VLSKVGMDALLMPSDTAEYPDRKKVTMLPPSSCARPDTPATPPASTSAWWESVWLGACVCVECARGDAWISCKAQISGCAPARARWTPHQSLRAALAAPLLSRPPPQPPATIDSQLCQSDRRLLDCCCCCCCGWLPGSKLRRASIS